MEHYIYADAAPYTGECAKYYYEFRAGRFIAVGRVTTVAPRAPYTSGKQRAN
ncbi:MAG TPA: hypothetical protein VE621_21060 [Bryobacteraceae bacterium]|nr:hypothetical protein [Bryobacteraceae bacterium]